VKEVTAPGPRATTFWYDADGRQTGTQLPSGLVTETHYDIRGLVTSTVVDPNPVGESGHLALTTQYAYDLAGRRTDVTDPRGFLTHYDHDEASRLDEITDAAEPTHGTVEFTHDPAGRITDVENARGYVSHFGYDEMGRVTAATDPLSRTHHYEYNGLGQLTRHVDPDGNDVRSLYDGANRLVEMNDGASTVYASYGYDGVGRITSASNYNGAVGYQYDAAGRVSQVSSPEGDVGYTYYGDGQRETMTLPGSRTVDYAYDGAGQLETVTDWASRATDYTYTADGLLDTVTRASGVHSAYGYDAADRLDAISHYDPSDVPLAEYAYDLDADGNRIGAEVTGSAVTNATETYGYDELDRLIEAAYDDGVNPLETVDYAYDANGNRVSVDDGTTTTTYTYDEADQLTDLGGLTLTYDPNGNRITAGSDSFVYDWADRLTEATVGGTSASFAYLADGTRESKVSGSTTTAYLHDREAGLPQVVDDGTTSYLRGAGLAAEVDDATGDAVSPLADGLGSVRARADATGAVVGTADWDAWGNPRASSGVTGDVGWAGAQRDGETGLTLLGDRYYAPGAARFLTRDTVSPNAGGTQGLNGYAYADGNPVTNTDPTGHGVAGVFAVVGRVLECALRGECRYRRHHEHTEPTKEAISGTPSAGHWSGGSGGGIGGTVVVCRPTPFTPCHGGVPGGPGGSHGPNTQGSFGPNNVFGLDEPYLDRVVCDFSLDWRLNVTQQVFDWATIISCSEPVISIRLVHLLFENAAFGIIPWERIGSFGPDGCGPCQTLHSPRDGGTRSWGPLRGGYLMMISFYAVCIPSFCDGKYVRTGPIKLDPWNASPPPAFGAIATEGATLPNGQDVVQYFDECFPDAGTGPEPKPFPVPSPYCSDPIGP
jgi:RHS repeat-associated protein